MYFLVSLFSSSYEELWKAIIRPFRDEYTDKDLGPEKFKLNQKYYKRSDFSIYDNRNIKLMCSFWEPYDEEREYTRLPCVIYLHGNSSSRCEVIPNLKYLLPLNITVFAFDFAACGHSEGEYISLGWYETLDVQCIIDFLRNSNKVSVIGLWGRSMGAVTSLMCAAKDQTIGGIFLDSPFYSLNLLIDELANEKVTLPNFLVRQVKKMIKETVKEKAFFNIDDIEPVEFAKKCFVPGYFCHGKNDTFVNVHHCKDLYKIYPGEKGILLIEGDHNTLRPNKLNEKAAEFFYNALKCKYIREINDNYIGYKLFFSDWNNPHYRTPKGDSEKEIKVRKKNSVYKNYGKPVSSDNFYDKINISKTNINKDDNDNDNDNNKKKYKFRNYKPANSINSSNTSNKVINKINYESNNIQNSNYNIPKPNENYFDGKKKKNHPKSSKNLYDFNTFVRKKKDSKIFLSQKNIIGNNNKLNQKKDLYFNNNYYNINTKQENKPFNKYDIIKTEQNTITRHFISPKQNKRKINPLPSYINLNQSDNISYTKMMKSTSPSYNINKNLSKNNNYNQFTYNNEIINSYISNNGTDEQTNSVYDNNYHFYNKNYEHINTEYDNFNSYNNQYEKYDISTNQNQDY